MGEHTELPLNGSRARRVWRDRERAGAPRGVEVVDLDMRQAERHGDMADAAVNPDHPRAAREFACQRIE